MKADVYYNLHKHTWSMRSRESEDYGTVRQHSDTVAMSDVEFAVQPAGRERVREEGKKNVHAFCRAERAWVPRITGDFVQAAVEGFGWVEVTYNPYKYDSFVTVEDERPVTHANAVMLVNGKCFAVNLTYASQN